MKNFNYSDIIHKIVGSSSKAEKEVKKDVEALAKPIENLEKKKTPIINEAVKSEEKEKLHIDSHANFGIKQTEKFPRKKIEVGFYRPTLSHFKPKNMKMHPIDVGHNLMDFKISNRAGTEFLKFRTSKGLREAKLEKNPDPIASIGILNKKDIDPSNVMISNFRADNDFYDKYGAALSSWRGKSQSAPTEIPPETVEGLHLDDNVQTDARREVERQLKKGKKRKEQLKEKHKQKRHQNNPNPEC